ncbi:OTU domain-containing protein [Rhizoctonia solani AG-1 IA]|uniref:Ubiquitin thioesterase OTU n=1 Tax=Thanatephorus cucumeris (strain AG1-IA) TaxID=983506 RepID=L8X7H1_THACA|nr:OTU domain-containing protein [Rhizoctonia solani AG-1 IA]
MSVPIRIRHPKGDSNIVRRWRISILMFMIGVSTLQVDLNSDSATVLSLQQSIHELSDLLPSQQELKSGYPPKALTLIPELPLSSLGLQRGDQITVTAKPGSVSATTGPSVPTAPVSAPRPPASVQTPKASTGSTNDGFVETDVGTLVHRVRYVRTVLRGSFIKHLIVVVDVIKNDPEAYPDVVLGESYMAAISKDSTWGGAIELSIFSDYFRTEIDSYDVETGRCDRFGEGKYDNRCVLMYSGIHYDAVSLAPTRDAPPDFHTTVFPVDGSDNISQAASKLASQLRASRKFTNTSTFDLKCEICGQGLKGEKEARAHAAQTGHTSFGEY